MGEKRQPKPAEGFASLDEEVAHWGRHGSQGAVDEKARVDVEIAPEARARMISIRLPGDLLDAVRVAARDRGVPYQTLMKKWLREALESERARHLPVASEGLAPYGEPAAAKLRDEELEELREKIAIATSLIAPEYFQLPVARAGHVYRERVYCYELYHQLRNVWGGCPYSFGGEVDKSGHPYFQDGPYAEAKPDLLVHRPGTMDGNLTVVEVKPASVSDDDGRKDLRKLTWFCKKAGYYRGVFLVYGESGEPGAVAAKIHAWHGDGIDFNVLDCFYHRRVGERALRLNL